MSFTIINKNVSSVSRLRNYKLWPVKIIQYFFTSMFSSKNEKTVIFTQIVCCTFLSLVFCGLPRTYISNKMFLNGGETRNAVLNAISNPFYMFTFLGGNMKIFLNLDHLSYALGSGNTAHPCQSAV